MEKKKEIKPEGKKPEEKKQDNPVLADELQRATRKEAKKQDVKPAPVDSNATEKQPIVTEEKLIATIKELGGKATIQQVRVKLEIPVKTGSRWNTEAMRVIANKAVEARTLKLLKEGNAHYYQAA